MADNDLRVRTFRFLRNKGIDVSIACENDATVEALLHGHLPVTKLLVKASANVEEASTSRSYGGTETKLMSVLIEDGTLNPQQPGVIWRDRGRSVCILTPRP